MIMNNANMLLIYYSVWNGLILYNKGGQRSAPMRVGIFFESIMCDKLLQTITCNETIVVSLLPPLCLRGLSHDELNATDKCD